MTFWHATFEVARKEAMQHLRTKRLLVIGILFVLSLAVTTIIIPVALFELDEFDPGEDEDAALENFGILFFLSAPVIGGYFFIQLLSIVLTSDGVSSEWQRKTIFLVLSKPVPRAAFVLGKFLGSVIPLVSVFGVLLVLDYLLLNAIMPGTPEASDWGNFLAAVGILSLGASAFAAMGLFFSTLTKSTVASLIATIAAGFVVFPIIGAIGDFTFFADLDNPGADPDESDWRYDWSHYASPANAMGRATNVLLDSEEAFNFVFLFPQNSPQRTLPSVLSLVGFTTVFLAGALLTVLRRDFE